MSTASTVTAPIDVPLYKSRWTITFAAAIGWFFDAYVITIYALTVPAMARSFHVSTVELSGVVGSVFLVGYTLGTIGFGMLGDIFGRKVMLGISIIGYGLATAITGFASGVIALAALRCLTGLAGGGELAIGAPYVNEVWSHNRRCSGVSFMYAFYPLGFLFAVGAFAVISPTFGWRAVYFFSIIPAAFILLFRMKLEESPRFQNVMSSMARDGKRQFGVITAIKNRNFRFRLLVGFLIFTSLTYGYYAMVFYIPSYVVTTYGLSANVGAPAVTALLMVFGVFGALSAGLLGDKVGRRWPAIIGAVTLMLSIYIWWGLTLPLFVFCLMVGVGGFLVAFEWAMGIVYVNELFPTEARAGGFGWSAGLGRVVSIAAPVVTQALSRSIGVAHAIEVSAAIWLTLVVGYLISHETHGVELMDRFSD